tara:strand:- start:12894 stop:13646 length:753 start_codon:yes stop_codon:yes gene_type:complete
MKTKQLVNKTYKLTRDAAPLSFMLPTRNSRRYPLMHFDEASGTNRALRYARNQKSPFEDEQDGNAIVEPIVFEDGFLSVPRTNQSLQEFLHYHPMNGSKFIEVDVEKDAQEEMAILNSRVDALIEARQLDIDQVEALSRVLFNTDVSRTTSAELKRDILIYAEQAPADFLRAVKDPTLKLNAKVKEFFAHKVLIFKNHKKDVYFNTDKNKKRMVNIPFGEDPFYVVAGYLQSDEGIDVLKFLEKNLENKK